VLTKNVKVMLLIVLAVAALFHVGVDVLYRGAIRKSGILPVTFFSQPRVL
jgi:hypothetical protein